MKSTDKPTAITLPFAASAGADYIRTVPVASQIGVVNGAASYTDGFPPDCFIPQAAGGYPPDGRDVNYILNVISAWSRWCYAGGSPTYDSAFSSAIGGYPNGAVLAMANGGGFWISTADNNTSDPDTGGADWSTLAMSQTALDTRYAALNGNAANAFAVANATTNTQAVARGQFGTGSLITTQTLLSGTNYNAITSPGMYRDQDASNTSTNRPGTAFGQLLVTTGGGDTVTQIYWNYSNSGYYWRSCSGAPSSPVWTTWNQVMGVSGGCFTGFVGFGSGVSFTPAVLVAVGDYFTGFHSGGTGELVVYANGNVLAQTTSSTFDFKIRPTQGGANIVNINDWTFSAASNGYTKLPNGLILQWGLNTGIGASTYTFNLPLTFPSNFFHIFASSRSFTYEPQYGNSVGGLPVSLSQYKLFCEYGSSDVSWLAIGN